METFTYRTDKSKVFHPLFHNFALDKQAIMKDRIFQKLKQNYSSLGLGSEVLQAHAESLAALGFVNDENLDTVISAQKTFLEGVQKANDKRATDAATKAKADAKKELEEAAKKAAEEKKKKEEEEAARREKEKEMPDWYKAEKAASDKAMKELLESNKTLQDAFNTIKTENDALKQKQAKEARQNLILSKAKELGVPQYRIDEGFSIAEDADENAISEYLTKVANNTKAQGLVGSRNIFPEANEKMVKEEADAIAKSLIH